MYIVHIREGYYFSLMCIHNFEFKVDVQKGP